MNEDWLRAFCETVLPRLPKAYQGDFEHCQARCEVRGIDVVVTVYKYDVAPEIAAELEIAVECKPSLGDDYPAVLREIQRKVPDRNAAAVVLVGDGGYTGVGATFDQVRKMFGSQNVVIVGVDEVARS